MSLSSAIGISSPQSCAGTSASSPRTPALHDRWRLALFIAPDINCVRMRRRKWPKRRSACRTNPRRRTPQPCRRQRNLRGETVLPGPKITFAFPGTASTVTSSDGRAAIVITGGVRIFRFAVNQSFLELQADKAVLYTRFRDLRGLDVVTESNGSSDAITGAYLEGDVRATFNPGPPKPFTLPRVGEVRMSANRIYYEFANDRAILTDAVVHTVEPAGRCR